MRAYEFYATPENGIIKIPKQLIKRIKSKVRVIVLEEGDVKSGGETAGIRKRTDLLSPISIDTRGWKFDKEEANER